MGLYCSSKTEKIRQIMRRYDGGGKLNPSIVRGLFKILMTTLEDPSEFFQTTSDIKCVLDEFNCQDQEVPSAIELLKFLFEIREYYITEDFCYWMANKEDIRVSVDQPDLFSDKKIRKKESFMKIYEKTLLQGNLDFLIMLLKLGKRFEFPTNFEIMPDTIVVLAILRKLTTDPHNPRFQDTSNADSPLALLGLDISRAIKQEQKHSEQSIQTEHFKMHPRRKSIVKLCISMLTESLYNEANAPSIHAMCLRIAFKAAEEPMVSSHEVEQYMRGLRFDEECDDFINAVTNLYIRFMPESIHKPSPRSLEHFMSLLNKEKSKESKSSSRGYPKIAWWDLVRQVTRLFKITFQLIFAWWGSV